MTKYECTDMFLFVQFLTRTLLFTCYAAQAESTSPQITPSVSCSLRSKAVPHNVKIFSITRRARKTCNEEPYELSDLSPNKPSIASGLSIWEVSSSWPVYQNHITVFTIQQRVFDSHKITTNVAYLKHKNFD